MAQISLEHTLITIPIDGRALEGDLTVPSGTAALILFAHGSGSSRRSPRNRLVAEQLNQGGFGTLLFDLLTPEEQQVDARTGELRFDIDLLTNRTNGAVRWARAQSYLQHRKFGLFGASTGAAAALGSAADHPEDVAAVVSRGGRPDLALDALPRVKAPTLLIVGGNDEAVIRMNREAQRQMNAPNRLEVIPGASHLFEEPGKLDEVARLTHEWFRRHLGDGARA